MCVALQCNEVLLPAGGPPTFRVSGTTHHLVGPLLPQDDDVNNVNSYNFMQVQYTNIYHYTQFPFFMLDFLSGRSRSTDETFGFHFFEFYCWFGCYLQWGYFGYH